MKRRGKKMWLMAALGLLLALLLALAQWDYARPGPLDASQRVQIAAGASLRASLARLAEIGAVRRPRLLEYWLRLRNARPLRAGTYDIAALSSARQIVEQMQSGAVAWEKLTLIEGWTFRQMRAQIEAQMHLRHDFSGLSDAQLMARIGAEGTHPEGQFFPDTYRFQVGSVESDIYRLAYQRTQQELALAWEGRASALPLKSAREALILASIVEKESGREDERALVAAVFVNRLRIGMRLQSDPTVIYGLGDRYDGDLRFRDMRSDTPYSTYTRSGLPPTPIALVSVAALRATLHPARSDALYFVATGAGDGRHYFSRTLREHNAAVARYHRRIGVRG